MKKASRPALFKWRQTPLVAWIALAVSERGGRQDWHREHLRQTQQILVIHIGIDLDSRGPPLSRAACLHLLDRQVIVSQGVQATDALLQYSIYRFGDIALIKTPLNGSVIELLHL